MPTPTGPSDPNIKNLIIQLEKSKSKIWRKISEQLSKPRRIRPEVNLSKINRYAPDKSTVAVAGKILGYGELNKKLTLTSISISQNALNKIEKSGSKYIPLKEYLKKNPTGKGVLILK